MKFIKSSTGSFLASAVVVTATFLFIALGMATYVFNRYHLVQRGAASSSAISAAQAGLDFAVEKINRDEYYYKYCACLGQEININTGGSSSDKVTYTILGVAHTTDSPRSAHEMTITVLGKVYQGTSSTVVSQKAIRANISALKPDGTKNNTLDSVIHAGYGSIEANSGQIYGTNLITSGYLAARGTTTTEAVVVISNIWAYAHTCGTGATFPTRCGTAEGDALGEEGCQGSSPQYCPVIQATNGHIPPPATSYYNGGINVTNLSGDAITPPDLPDLHRNDIENNVVQTVANYTCSGGTLYMGTKPGETTLVTGVVSITSACNAFMQGDLWVLGNFDVGSNSTLWTADTDVYGNMIRNAPVAIVDGYSSGIARSISFRSNGTQSEKNAYGIGKILASYYCNLAFQPSRCQDETITGAEIETLKGNVWVEIEPGTSNVQTHNGLALMCRWCTTFARRDITMNGSLIGQGVSTSSNSLVVDYSSPDDLNLGGRQGKIFKIKSYTEILEPDTSGATTTIDSNSGSAGTNYGRTHSVTIGSDGYPVIAYYRSDTFDLMMAKCNDERCSSSSSSTVDATGVVGNQNSIAIGSDGYPVIAYLDDTNDDLKVAKCNDLTCTSKTITAVETAAGMGLQPSIKIGPDGFPIIAHYYLNNYTRVVRCGNLACSSGNTITNVDGSGGGHNSMEIGIDYRPIIAEWRGLGSGVLGVLKCGSYNCATGNAAANLTTDDGGNHSVGNSIAIGLDGKPIISYGYAYTGATVKVAKCANISCSSGSTITTVSTDMPVFTSITLRRDGIPLVAYNTNSSVVKLVTCGNVSCSSGNTTTTVGGGYAPKIVIGRDGLPVIAYVSNSSATAALSVKKCANLTCT